MAKAKKKAPKKTTKTKRKQRSVVVELVFTEALLDELLEAATFGDREPRRVKDMTDAEFKRFAKDIKDTEFMTEIMDGSRDACANDWLCDWAPEDDDEDEEEEDE